MVQRNRKCIGMISHRKNEQVQEHSTTGKHGHIELITDSPIPHKALHGAEVTNIVSLAAKQDATHGVPYTSYTDPVHGNFSCAIHTWLHNTTSATQYTHNRPCTGPIGAVHGYPILQLL